MSKCQVDSRSAIALLLGNLATGMLDLMASFGNNMANVNKEIRSIVTALRARGGSTENLLPHLFAKYDDCSSDHGPFTHYIEML